jgi:hypothetical protein
MLINKLFPRLQRCISVIFIFCFTLNSIAQIDHWEAIVYEYDNWDYLVPDAPVSPDWNTVGFATDSWGLAPGGFGYGDDDDNTILPAGTISVYQRFEFELFDTSAIRLAALTIDYDDSFVAYLNGVEIARNLLAGEGQPDYNQLAFGLHEAQLYAGVYPAQYTISKELISAILTEGVNVLAVQTHNQSASSSDLSSRVYFHVGINNESTEYRDAAPWFNPPFVFEQSELPIVVINTVDEVEIVDEPKVAGVMGIINGADGMNLLSDPFNEFYGEIGIEIRGSTSSGFPKKSYGLETRGPDSTNYNATIFDWPADNDWILYAPYSDKSLIRNVLTFKLGNEMGEYAPRTKAVELVVNGDYRGVYIFMERIKQNPGRVDIAKLEYEDTEDNALTGGYIIKIDKTTGSGVLAWTSPYLQAPPAWGNISFQLHDPELAELHPLQLDYIRSYITDFETALIGPDFEDPELGYKRYIDLQSFLDFMIVNEISKNVDGYRISTFMHKQRLSEGGKLFAGPLWDFNLAWGNANYCEGGSTTGWEIYFNNVCGGGGGLNNPFYWNRFVEDEAFTHALNCRWQELRMTTLHSDSIADYIDEMHEYLANAADRNFQRWPVLGTYVWPNNFIGLTYAQEIDYLKTWMELRMLWLDENMFGSCEDLGISEESLTQIIQVFPNPTDGKVQVSLSEPIKKGRVEVANLVGEIVLRKELTEPESVQLDLSTFKSGLYFLTVFDSAGIVAKQKIIRN